MLRNAALRKWTLSCILCAGFVSFGIADKVYAFVPGSGTSITEVIFTATPDLIGCLFVSKNDVYPSQSPYPEVDLEFPAPSTYGATTVTLQFAAQGTSPSWANYQHSGSDLTTAGNNFSIQPTGDYQYRLLFNGDPVAGNTSNVVEVTRSTVNTRFSSWGISEDMSITGIMWPWVGRGMTATFTALDNTNSSDVTGDLSYQWYRVNPLTYDTMPIAGATNLTYTTTSADVGGYLLYCRATGNGTTVGGFAQVRTSGILIPNLASVTSVGPHGFTLNLEKPLNDSLLPDALSLNYTDPTTFQTIDIPITAVTKTADGIYAVTAELPSTGVSLYLSNASGTWSIAEETPWGDTMQGLTFTAPKSSFLLFLPAIIAH